MKENKAQIKFNQYLRECRLVGFFELKVAKGNTFNFKDIEEHQYEGLQSTAKNGLVWKLSDEDRRKKPCDTLSIPPLPSYLVIQFDDTFYLIRIEHIVKMIENSERSITKDEAREYADLVIHT
jgi:penicillin-binding protein-related factor A (putative recombinase)